MGWGGAGEEIWRITPYNGRYHFYFYFKAKIQKNITKKEKKIIIDGEPAVRMNVEPVRMKW